MDAYRQERIERLLKELKYEMSVGMIQGEIDESITFQFIVPVSKAITNGVVWVKLESRPIPAYMAPHDIGQPKMRVVK